MLRAETNRRGDNASGRTGRRASSACVSGTGSGKERPPSRAAPGWMSVYGSPRSETTFPFLNALSRFSGALEQLSA